MLCRKDNNETAALLVDDILHSVFVRTDSILRNGRHVVMLWEYTVSEQDVGISFTMLSLPLTAFFFV